VEEYLIQLNLKTQSISVSREILRALRSISTFRGNFVRNSKVLSISMEQLYSRRDAVTRQLALLLISSLVALSNKPRIPSNVDIQKILNGFMHDPDPRVRTASLSSLLHLHYSGIRLESYLYDSAVSMLHDDFEDVREQATKLIWVLSCVYPNQSISSMPNLLSSTSMETESIISEHAFEVNSSSRTIRIRLLDDAFTRTCATVTDPCISIRKKACSLLSNFENVGDAFLLQTFSKEVLAGQHKGKLSLTRTKQTTHVQDKMEAASDEEDSIVVAEDSVNLLDSGAVGIFIQGLEDEFFEVRNATIDSICELSLRSDKFASRAVDFLVDVFNDEIDSVRINAIDSLRKISLKISLKEEQLHTVLSCLEDSSSHVRHAVHNLLRCTTLSSVQCLLATVQALLSSTLHRYASDLESTFGCLQSIGINHPTFTEFIVEDLLRIDARFEPIEPHFDDLYYVGTMVVVLNAAKLNPHIHLVLPKYVSRHFRYLKDRWSNYFPEMPVFQQVIESHTMEGCRVEEFLTTSLKLLSSTNILLTERKFPETKRILRIVSRFLSRVTVLNELLKPNAQVYLLYIKAMEVFLKVRATSTMVSSEQKSLLRSSESIGDINSCKNVTQKIFRIFYRMEHQFLGLDLQIKVAMKLWKIYMHILFLLADMPSQMTSLIPSQQQTYLQRFSSSASLSMRLAFHPLSERLELLKVFCQQHSLPMPEGTVVLLEKCKKVADLSSGSNRRLLAEEEIATTSELIHFTNHFMPIAPQLNNIIKRSAVEKLTVNPATSSEKPVEVLLAFPVSICIHCSVENISPNELKDIFLKVIFPDGTMEMFAVPREHFEKTKPFHYSMKTQISIGTDTFSRELACVSLTLVKCYRLEVAHFDCQFVSTTNDTSRIRLGLLPLHKPFQCYFSLKKGIAKK